MAGYREERESILRAAYRLIGRQRNSTTSVHEILAEAGLSTRSFYRHFASKDELILAMYRTDSERVAATLAVAVTRSTTPRAALEAWIDGNLAVVFDQRRSRHVATLTSPEVASAEGFAEAHREGMASQRESLVSLLTEGRQYGAFPKARPETDALAIQAVVGVFMQAQIEGLVEHDRHEVRRIVLDVADRLLA